MFRTLRFYHSFFKFLSTPSSRRATQDQIHHLWRGGHFYPRPPRGGRLSGTQAFVRWLNISIHALREEGDCSPPTRGRPRSNFYPRPPRGGRPESAVCSWMPSHFYPRPPRGGRLPPVLWVTRYRSISIHALREEGDGFPFLMRSIGTLFLSTPSARRATRIMW